jgi:predicted nucleic acid-binding protein
MYLIDAHALVWYVVGKLPERADAVFKDAEAGKTVLYVPTIVLAECLHLVEKGKIKLNFRELLDRIKSSDNFVSVPFDLEILELMQDIKGRDLHDRVIIATALRMNAKILTKDKGIAATGLVETVW